MSASYPEPGRVTSGVLAVVVHLLFIGLLVFGISWQQRKPEPIVADLWREIPPPQKPQPVVKAPPPEPIPPPPAPKPEPKPEPPKPAPEPKPLPPAQPSKAEIELKEKQRKQKEERIAAEERRQEELRKKEEARKEEAERRREEQLKQEELKREEKLKQEELKRQEAERRKEEEKRQDEARREDERRMEKEAETRRNAIIEEQQKLARAAKIKAEEDARKRAIAEAEAARAKQIAQFIDRIRRKIKGHVAAIPGMPANAEALYSVILLPGGEVLEIKLVKSSGVPAYDAAVERAIRLASPLPVPSEPDLFAGMRQGTYKFRPNE